jgi:hypothetical protein
MDPEFFQRADAQIALANSQLSDTTGPGRVSASLLYSAARFNAWVSATGFASGAEMAELREQTVAYFVQEYTHMLRENLDDYIQHFERYLQTKPEEIP